MARESAKARVPVRIEDPASVASEVERMHERILNRAFEIFSSNASAFGKDLDHWLAAERELLWQPSVEVRENDEVYTVEAAVPGVDPKDLEVEVTPNDVLIKGETRREHDERKGTVLCSEFESGSIFRRVSFPQPIDTRRVQAVYKDGLLHLTAPIAASPGAGESTPVSDAF